MQVQSEKPLKILNASAGSGKTFNLVKEYIQLLLSDGNISNRFASIIAMTFTNKAALEMKTRIIQALDELSFPDRYGKKSDQYALLIGEALGINPEEVHTRAQKVLKNILHRYEDFHVMTIDKFNLKLIRSFSRDLNLPNDFEIILNENEVIERVVDTMMSQLGQADLEKLTQLVFAYAKSNVEEGEKWDFRKDLIRFASILQKENYFGIVEKLMNFDFSKESLDSLRFEKSRMEDHFVGECQQVLTIFRNQQLQSSNLHGGVHTVNAIEKLATLKSIPATLFSDSFLINCEKEMPENKRFPLELSHALLQLQVLWQNCNKQYASLALYIKNFYNMALLQFMAKQLETVRKDEQLIRISEFNKLISELVKNEDAPFIYERLGTRFHHFLLDEFQDTSHLQWLNMVPLVHESIAQQNRNLIVGDPKQSIYRFKNGVAEQFVALPQIYNPDNDPKVAERSLFFETMGEMQVLKENWRSSPVIVDFNNRFFELLKPNLEPNFQAFYNSISQIPRSTKSGTIEILSKIVDEISTDEEIAQIVKWITACENDGFKRGDICILGNKNKDCSRWANELSSLGYQVVSADSLLVDSDPVVQLTIAYLRRRLQPMSENERRRFAEKYFRLYPENGYLTYKSYLEKQLSESTGKIYTNFNDQRFIEDRFGSKSAFFAKYENLYDLIEKFYDLLKVDELSNPYLHHLADMAHEYDLTKGPDLKGFLEYYNGQGKKSAVQLPESSSAIRIMSIHKSKGLEFPVVILPKMSLEMRIKADAKFLIPTDQHVLYTSASENSPIDEVHDFATQEIGQVVTDSINKCYVAMTRPIERLYINNTFKKDAKFSALFHSILEGMNDEKQEIEGGFVLQLGDQKQHQNEKEDVATTFFTPVNIADRLWFPDISLQDQDHLLAQDSLSEAQRYGNQLHLLLSLVNDSNDVDAKLEILIKEGLVEVEFAERMKSESLLLFSDTSYQQLFDHATEILSEQSIIAGEFTVIRPDKIILKKDKAVVIDYKTGLPNAKYQKQVREYVTVLAEIGYTACEGYILYTTTKNLEQVC